MSHESLLAFALFACVSSLTPGPNNMMLLAAGVNFGLRATLPHITGICFGFFVLLVSVGFGLAEVFQRLPLVFTILKFAGGFYLLYLALRIATAAPPDASDGATLAAARPMTVLNAATFQWANPKAWVMAVTAFSTYAPASPGVLIVLLVATWLALISVPSALVWTMLGARLRNALQNPRILRWFNYTMAALLVASLYPLLTVSN